MLVELSLNPEREKRKPGGTQKKQPNSSKDGGKRKNTVNC